MSALNIGDPAPDFTLSTDSAGDVSLKDFKGQWLVLYFYPKDNTSGCTKQAIGFTENMDVFKGKNATILGVSKDSIKSHGNFREKQNLGILLGSDPECDVIKAYGLWVEKSMYGRTYMGVDRSTFLIGPDGKIHDMWRKVKVTGHVEKVLQSLEKAVDSITA